jgi:RHS repeat-associated protein
MRARLFSRKASERAPVRGNMNSPQSPFITRPLAELLGNTPGYGFAGVGVSTAIGNFTTSQADLSFPGSMLGLLDWTRTYNSLGATGGILGNGFSHALSASLILPEQGPGQENPQSIQLQSPDGRVLTYTPDPAGGYTRPPDLSANLQLNDDGTFALSFISGETWTFDPDGRLTQRSLEGQNVVVSYGPSGLPATAVHSSGRQLNLSYDTSGRLTSVAADDGRVVGYGYAVDGSLSSVTDPAGGITQYAAAPGGQIATITDPDGNLMVSNTYGTEGRIERQEFPTGAAVDFGYDDSTGATTVTTTPSGAKVTFQADAIGRMTSVTDADGNAATFGYDANGNLTEAVSPGGSRLAQTFDAAGNLLSSDFGGATETAAYDGQNRPVTMTDAAGGSTTFGYIGDSHIPTQITGPDGAVTTVGATAGQVTAVTDADGFTTTCAYDGSGNLVSVSDAQGQLRQLSYDAAGYLTEIVARSGAATRLTRDAAGRVTSSTDQDGNTDSYQYSAAGRLLATTNAAGGVTTRTYNGAGLLASATDPLGRTTAFGYDGEGNPVSITAPGGEITRSGYDHLGRLASITDPAGGVTSYAYDGDGNVVTTQTPSGAAHASYDARGNPLSITDPANGTTRCAYDAADRLVSVIDPVGGTWLTAYDAAGNLSASTDPLGAVTGRTWTPGRRLSAVTDPLGNKTSLSYDGVGRVSGITDPESGTATYTRNQDGLLTLATSAAGLATGYAYDPSGKIVAITDPRGWISRTVYDALGRQIALITPGGSVTHFLYDAAGQLTETTNPNGSITRYGYDESGRLTMVTDAKGSLSRYTYDSAGRLTSATDPLGQTTTLMYDSAGNLISVTDPSGQSQHMTYDANRRLTGRTADGTPAVSFTYDAAGRRSSMTDATGTTYYSYDSGGRLASVTAPDGELVTAAYNAAGQMTALTYPDGLKVSYDYDGNGRLIGLHDARAGDAVYALDRDGRLLTEQLPGRSARRYRYDGGLLSQFLAFHNGEPVFQARLSRDPDGRILSQEGIEYLTRYRYDAAGQLVSAVRHQADPGPADRRRSHGRAHADARYAYDAVGNRAVSRLGDIETHYRYDASDQLLAKLTGGRRVEYRYDSSGRLIEEAEGDRARFISYDGFGRPAAVRRALPGRHEVAQLAFDGDGLLASLVLTVREDGDEQERSATVRYRWGTGRVPHILSQRADPATDDEAADRGRLNSDFTYGYGRTFASWDHGSAVFHEDELSSAVRTEETRDWTLAREYAAFGEPEEPEEPRDGGTGHREGRQHTHRKPTAPELPRFGYRGELALGSMLYLRARAYDTDLGRFLTRDLVGTPPVPGQVGNPYAYAANDPLNSTDPLGQWPSASTLSHIRRSLSGVRHNVAHYLDTHHIPGTDIPYSLEGKIAAIAFDDARREVYRFIRADISAQITEFRDVAPGLAYSAAQINWHDAAHIARSVGNEATKLFRKVRHRVNHYLDTHDIPHTGIPYNAIGQAGGMMFDDSRHEIASAYHWLRHTLRLPDYITLSLSLPFQDPFDPLLPNGIVISETRQGKVFVGPQWAVSTSGDPLSASLNAGWIDQSRPPSASEVNQFVGRESVSGNVYPGGLFDGAGPDIGETWGDPGGRRAFANSHNWATELGIGFGAEPSIGGSYSYSYQTSLNLGGWSEAKILSGLASLPFIGPPSPSPTGPLLS